MNKAQEILNLLEADAYSSLNDASKVIPSLASGGTEIWYNKNPRFETDGVTKSSYKSSHNMLGKVKETDLDKIYQYMQGEFWSPRGEARDLISKLGLRHTSMSVGDVIVVGGVAHIVTNNGFEELK